MVTSQHQAGDESNFPANPLGLQPIEQPRVGCPARGLMLKMVAIPSVAGKVLSLSPSGDGGMREAG